MKKILSFKLFELNHYYSLLIIFTAALSFAALVFIQFISKGEYKEQLEDYTKSYLTYSEISPDIVKEKLTSSTSNLNWNTVLKYENSVYIKASTVNSTNGENWRKYVDVHKRLKKLLTEATAFSDDSLKEDLVNKTDKFLDFVKKNDWKRLTRIGERLKVHAESLNENSVNKLKQELSRVKAITEKSLLSNYEKSAILARISRMSEVDKFESLFKAQKELLIVVGVYTSLYSKWHNEMGEVFSLKRDQFLNSDFFTTAFIVMSLFFLMNGIGYFALRKKISSGQQEKIESKFEEIVEGIVFRNKEINLDMFSEGFKKVVSRFQDHLFRRMNFGAVAEQGIPFPSILVDKDLRVCWMNKLAQNKLGINFDLTENNYLSWDQVKELTSFHDFDPIADGIKFNNGGIFDTTVNLADGTKDRAEFFVSPVAIENENYVFLSFQLQSYYQEILENNKSSILQPLEDTFKYLFEEEFEKVDIEKKKVFFDTVETKKIYPIIEKVINRYIEAIVSLKEALAISCEDNKNKEEELHALINSKETNVRVMLAQTENFKALKKNIANLDALVGKNFQNISDFQSSLSEHIGSVEGQQDLINDLRTDLGKVKSNINSFKELLHTKNSLTESLRGQKIEIKHLANQMTNNSSENELVEKLDQLVINLEAMDQFYRDLDVHLGKLEYYFAEISNKEETLGYDLDGFIKKVEREFFLIDQLEANFESVLDNFATNLESQFNVLRSNKVLAQKHYQENVASSILSNSEIS